MNHSLRSGPSFSTNHPLTAVTYEFIRCAKHTTTTGRAGVLQKDAFLPCTRALVCPAWQRLRNQVRVAGTVDTKQDSLWPGYWPSELIISGRVSACESPARGSTVSMISYAVSLCVPMITCSKITQIRKPFAHVCDCLGLLPGTRMPFRRRASDFELFHSRMGCAIIANTRAAACAETERPARCNEEWPLNNMRYALFSRAWYKERTSIVAAQQPKTGKRPHKFCYIGRSPRHKSMRQRIWIEEWARRHFDNTSIFVYTDVNRTTKLVGTDRLQGGTLLRGAQIIDCIS